MRRFFLFLFVVVFSLLPVARAEGATSLSSQKLFRHTRDDGSRKAFIVKFRTEKAMEAFISERRLPSEPTHRFQRFDMVAVELSGREAAELSRDRDVLLVQEDQIYYLHANGPYGKLPERLRKGRTLDTPVTAKGIGGVIPEEEYQWNIRKLGAEDYHRRGFMGRGAKVAVIDTGIDTYHPDLHVVAGISMRPSVVPNYYTDVLGHGTHVAGIIAGKLNGFGIVGVAPEAELYSVAVFNIFGQASETSIIAGLQWCIDQKMDIVNMSFGSPFTSATLKDACSKAYASGLLLVAAAGNAGRSTVDTVGYPAGFDTVIAVSATDVNDEMADWSSRGDKVEVSAPGADILSTFTFPVEYAHEWEYLSGTSMACPHVVGLAALIRGANPGISNVELRRRIVAFAKDLGPEGRDRDYGFGLAQVNRPDAMPDASIPSVTAGGPYRGMAGQPVQFTASGTFDLDDNFLIFEWDFGNGKKAAGARPTHIFDKPGDYTVTLTVTDGGGLRDTAVASAVIRAGVEKTIRLSTADAGYVKAPGTFYLRNNNLTAGMQSGKRCYGLARFMAPEANDIFILSAELDLTGYMKKTTAPEGTISAGILPAEISQAWPSTFDLIDKAQVLGLEPTIVLSSLVGQVAQGKVNVFTVPYSRIEEFERLLQGGSVAFRISHESTRTSNYYAWKKPELVVRYLESVSTANMAPVAHAGYDRRVRAGTVVSLDGSASYDPENTPLRCEWVQVSGPAVSLSTSAGSPVAFFTAPAGNQVLEFELRTSDGTHAAMDRVRIYLNDVRSDVHTMTLVPGYGNAGYVDEGFPDVTFLDRRLIRVGALPREEREGDDTTWAKTSDDIHFGAIQFDLSGIPAGSQITSAKLEMTGATTRPGYGTNFEVKVMAPAVDDLWPVINYRNFSTAPVVAVLSPRLNNRDLEYGKTNRFTVPPAILEERRMSTGRVTFRIDGPTLFQRWWQWFYWWSGNEEATRDQAPKLVITYAASQPTAEEPEPLLMDPGSGATGPTDEDDMAPPVVTLLSPGRNAVLYQGEEVEIAWEASDESGVSVDLFSSDDGALSWIEITRDREAAGSLMWSVPESPGGEIRLRVVAGDSAGNKTIAVRVLPIR